MQLPENIIVFDLETTDLSLGPGEIIEVGAVQFSKDFKAGLSYSQVVQPLHPEWVTKYTTELTGITREEVDAAPTWEEVWKDFAEFTNFNKTLLGAGGVYFDVPVLRHAYNQYDLGYAHMGRSLDLKSMVYGIFMQIGLRPKSWGLKAICKHFEIENPQAHRALPDAQTTARLLSAVSAYSLELENADYDTDLNG